MSTPLNPEAAAAEPLSRFARISQVLMAGCLGVMAVAVFVNVVLRYGFAFAVFGGIPKRGIYDNMRTAVDRVGRGKLREVNARFSAMATRPKPFRLVGSAHGGRPRCGKDSVSRLGTIARTAHCCRRGPVKTAESSQSVRPALARTHLAARLTADKTLHSSSLSPSI